MNYALYRLTETTGQLDMQKYIAAMKLEDVQTTKRGEKRPLDSFLFPAATSYFGELVAGTNDIEDTEVVAKVSVDTLAGERLEPLEAKPYDDIYQATSKAIRTPVRIWRIVGR